MVYLGTNIICSPHLLTHKHVLAGHKFHYQLQTRSYSNVIPVAKVRVLNAHEHMQNAMPTLRLLCGLAPIHVNRAIKMFFHCKIMALKNASFILKVGAYR